MMVIFTGYIHISMINILCEFQIIISVIIGNIYNNLFGSARFYDATQ